MHGVDNGHFRKETTQPLLCEMTSWEVWKISQSFGDTEDPMLKYFDTAKSCVRVAQGQ